MSHEPPPSLPASVQRCLDRFAGRSTVPAQGDDLLPIKAARLRQQLTEALIPYSGPHGDGSGQYRGGDYLLGPHSAMPTWFNTALFGVPLQASDGPYPEVARIWNAVDWPGLVDDHPEFLTTDQAQTSSSAPNWARVRAAHAEVHAAGYIPMLDIALSVSRDARVTLCPLGLIVAHITDSRLIKAVSDILRGVPADPDLRIECDDLRADTGYVEWSW
ncbi:Uncharacterised protein [Mycobacteroides abscessus subsp. abscessus]|uniref:hypothetical protein n=2 Tax=Mycobacteroides abscessus TaxID=36809 RepID=UPI000928C49C|nr:hypothetical protein [Mycobacteroides abscessus]SHS18419.1 Uncharacterised protein [Mycobacteroides abscessus subsp. abscessus]